MSRTVRPSGRGDRIQRHGFAEPLATADKRGVWPTCFAYLRGRDPSAEEILGVRAQMVQFCQANQLHLARIFHDLDVEPTTVDYPSFRELAECLGAMDTDVVLLADLELAREPSGVLTVISLGLTKKFPGLKMQCFVQAEIHELLARRDA